MIINALLTLVYNIFSVIFSPIHIPSFDEGSITSINNVLSMIFDDSEAIIGLFIPWTVVNIILPIIIALSLALPVYHLVMWILKKIPFLGVS